MKFLDTWYVCNSYLITYRSIAYNCVHLLPSDY